MSDTSRSVQREGNGRLWTKEDYKLNLHSDFWGNLLLKCYGNFFFSCITLVCINLRRWEGAMIWMCLGSRTLSGRNCFGGSRTLFLRIRFVKIRLELEILSNSYMKRDRRASRSFSKQHILSSVTGEEGTWIVSWGAGLTGESCARGALSLYSNWGGSLGTWEGGLFKESSSGSVGDAEEIISISTEKYVGVNFLARLTKGLENNEAPEQSPVWCSKRGLVKNEKLSLRVLHNLRKRERFWFLSLELGDSLLS